MTANAPQGAFAFSRAAEERPLVSPLLPFVDNVDRQRRGTQPDKAKAIAEERQGNLTRRVILRKDSLVFSVFSVCSGVQDLDTCSPSAASAPLRLTRIFHEDVPELSECYDARGF